MKKLINVKSYQDFVTEKKVSESLEEENIDIENINDEDNFGEEKKERVKKTASVEEQVLEILNDYFIDYHDLEYEYDDDKKPDYLKVKIAPNDAKLDYTGEVFKKEHMNYNKAATNYIDDNDYLVSLTLDETPSMTKDRMKRAATSISFNTEKIKLLEKELKSLDKTEDDEKIEQINKKIKIAKKYDDKASVDVIFKISIIDNTHEDKEKLKNTLKSKYKIEDDDYDYDADTAHKIERSMLKDTYDY